MSATADTIAPLPAAIKEPKIPVDAEESKRIKRVRYNPTADGVKEVAHLEDYLALMVSNCQSSLIHKARHSTPSMSSEKSVSISKEQSALYRWAAWISDQIALAGVEEKDEKKNYETLRRLLSSNRHIRKEVIGMVDAIEGDCYTPHDAISINWIEEELTEVSKGSTVTTADGKGASSSTDVEITTHRWALPTDEKELRDGFWVTIDGAEVRSTSTMIISPYSPSRELSQTLHRTGFSIKDKSGIGALGSKEFLDPKPYINRYDPASLPLGKFEFCQDTLSSGETVASPNFSKIVRTLVFNGYPLLHFLRKEYVEPWRKIHIGVHLGYEIQDGYANYDSYADYLAKITKCEYYEEQIDKAQAASEKALVATAVVAATSAVTASATSITK
jgi:hypothetical protein